MSFFNKIANEVMIEQDEHYAITRNWYGALVLITYNIVIGDIDCGIDKKHRAFNQFNKLRKLHYPRTGMILYKTANGYRFIITDASHQPDSFYVQDMFDKLACDRTYSKLCIRYNSYRARLTPKPWRIGLENPKNNFTLAWLNAYTETSESYSVCQVFDQFNIKSGGIGDARIAEIVCLHNKYTCTDKPLA